jgi:GNAT superfamily N-acetyltransferase
MVITAQSKHIKKIVQLCEQYFNESPYRKTHKFDTIQCTEFIRSCIIKLQYEIVVDVTEKDELSGFSIGYLTDYGWCNDYRVSLEFIYVLPQYRGTTAAKDMLEHMEYWGSKMKAKEIMLGDIGFRPDAIATFYESLGYSDRGVCLRKVL